MDVVERLCTLHLAAPPGVGVRLCSDHGGNYCVEGCLVPCVSSFYFLVYNVCEACLNFWSLSRACKCALQGSPSSICVCPVSLPVCVLMGMCLRCSAVRNEPVAERVPLQCSVFVIRDSMRTKLCVRQLVDLQLRLARSAVVKSSHVCCSSLPPPSPSRFLPSTVRTAASCSCR